MKNLRWFLVLGIVAMIHAGKEDPTIVDYIITSVSVILMIAWIFQPIKKDE